MTEVGSTDPQGDGGKGRTGTSGEEGNGEMGTSLIERDALVGNLLDKVDEMERRIRYLEDTHPGAGGEAADKLAYYRETDGSMHAPGELCPDGEASWGIWSRLVNRGVTPIDHFRSGAIPDGFSWINDGTFGGTPGVLAYNFRGTYLRTYSQVGPYFLADAITVYANKVFMARLMTGITTEIGVRLDDGSNDNYAEIVLDPDDVGAYRVNFRYRAGGGGVTDIPGSLYPCSEMIVAELYWYSVTPQVLGFIVGEHGETFNLSGFGTGAVGWTPARIGIVMRNNDGNYAYCDWIYSDFA